MLKMMQFSLIAPGTGFSIARRIELPLQAAQKAPGILNATSPGSPSSSISPQSFVREADRAEGSGKPESVPQQAGRANGNNLGIDVDEDASFFDDEMVLESHPISASKSYVSPQPFQRLVSPLPRTLNLPSSSFC